MSNLPIDITSLSEAELRQLNHKIVERLRFLRDAKAHHHMRELQLGDHVTFSPEPGVKVSGTVIRLNRKTLTLVASDGTQWRVSPSLVQRVRTEDIEVEVSSAAHTASTHKSGPHLGLRTFPLFQTQHSQDTPRNAPCPCGSGKKHKRCCLLKSAAG